jgi:hypothetical protein
VAEPVQVALVNTDWQIHPRNIDLSRTFDPLSGWNSLVLVERYGPPDSWVLTGPASALSVFAPGMGCLLDRNGDQISSGQVTGISRAASTDNGRAVDNMTVAFASDLAAFGGRVVRPSPATALTPGVIGTFPDAYDLRTGIVEDLILGYISSHIGALALTDRRLARLRLPSSLGRGGTTQVSGRFDNLGVLVQALAEAGGLLVRLVHTEDSNGPWLDLVIDEVRDLSVDIRFGTAETTAAGIIKDWSYEISAPTTTRPLLGLGGELELREVLEIRDTAAEVLWGRSWETFVDQRGIDPDSTDKLAEATREAEQALEAGRGPVKVSFTPVLGPDLEYRRDVRMGDLVGYDLPGLEPAEDKIREATTTVSAESGVTESTSVVVGTPDAPSSRSQQQTAKALRSINVIQRSK